MGLQQERASIIQSLNTEIDPVQPEPDENVPAVFFFFYWQAAQQKISRVTFNAEDILGRNAEVRFLRKIKERLSVLNRPPYQVMSTRGNQKPELEISGAFKIYLWLKKGEKEFL